MYTMGPRTERVIHFLTWLVQGPSYLSPRGFDNGDQRRNTLPFDFVTMGELFQNNHHKYGASPDFAARWFEIDPGWQVLRLLAAARIVTIRTAQRATYPEAIPAAA